MVRRRAGFEADEARRNLGKEREDLAASQPLAQHYAAHLVDRMNLEDALCQIKTNCCNIAHGWLPLLVISNDHHPGTSMPSGGHPPHQLVASFTTRPSLGMAVSVHVRSHAFQSPSAPAA